MLRRDHHGVDSDGTAVVVLDGDLALAVRPKVGQHPGPANVGQSLGQAVGHSDRHRHQLFGVPAGVADHHALVPRPGLVEPVGGPVQPYLERLVDAHGDVGGLGLDGHDHPTRLSIDPELGVGVADALDRVSHDLRDLDVRAGGDLAGHEDDARCHEGFARDAPQWVVGQHRVEHGVGDLVGQLVRMALCDRFGGEQVSPPHGSADYIRAR